MKKWFRCANLLLLHAISLLQAAVQGEFCCLGCRKAKGKAKRGRPKGRKASSGKVPDSWAYVNNFDDPYQPCAVRLPSDKGCAIRDEMDELLEVLREELPRAFESEQYQQHYNRIGRKLDEARTAKFQGLEARMIERGFALLRTPMGLVIAPVIDGEVLSREQYD